MIRRNRPALVLFCLLLLTAPSGHAQPRSAAPLLRAFFEALNSDDPEAMARFGDEGFTSAYRQRRTPEEDRELRDRVRRDLGALTIESMRRDSPSRAVVGLSAEKVPLPVEFAFDLADGRIDGFSVRVGGPPSAGSALVEIDPAADEEELAATLDRQLVELAADDRFSGVVLLARNGEPFFHRGYGLADRESGRTVETTTRFDVGSITKMLTKIAIARLAEDGELDLDDRLAEHLPGYPDREVAGRITVRQLVEHTSGLGDIFGPRWAEADKTAFVEPADFFPLFADQPLQFAPGEGRAYSNAGYVTLGAVVAAVSGRPYFDYIEETIFRPAAMTRSGFPVKDGKNAELAIGYTRSRGSGPGEGSLTSNLGQLPIRGCPAGSSSHTAEDLLVLDRALRAGKLLSEEWTRWVLGTDGGATVGSATIGVAGGGPGVSAGWESNGEITAIVLANLDPPSGERLALDLFRALTADESAPGPGAARG